MSDSFGAVFKSPSDTPVSAIDSTLRSSHPHLPDRDRMCEPPPPKKHRANYHYHDVHEEFTHVHVTKDNGQVDEASEEFS